MPIVEPVARQAASADWRVTLTTSLRVIQGSLLMLYLPKSLLQSESFFCGLTTMGSEAKNVPA